MSVNNYSSSDFGAVPAQLSVELPHRLLHKDVQEKNNRSNDTFSTQRKHRVNIVDLPSKVLSMTIGGLEPNQAT
ncbi:MAG: hypothetical protein NWQ13_02505, partial [Glaciimonas sp.]|nr:hypothetical protein [Glaciimonas sp.]